MLFSNSNLISDDAIVLELGARLAQLRLAHNLTQAQLAAQAGVAKRTVERLEAGSATQLHNFVRICRALNVADNFDLLVPAPVISPIELLRLNGARRLRASRASKNSTAKSELKYVRTEAPPTWAEAMRRMHK
jgi:transcriptional regulator with XRE-family HTH domain